MGCGYWAEFGGLGVGLIRIFEYDAIGLSVWVTKVSKFWCGCHTNLGKEVKLSETCVGVPCAAILRPQGIPDIFVYDASSK